MISVAKHVNTNAYMMRGKITPLPALYFVANLPLSHPVRMISMVSDPYIIVSSMKIAAINRTQRRKAGSSDLEICEPR